MATRFEETEENRIEQMTTVAEMVIEKDDNRKDLKERRGIIKQALYDGSHKLKHLIPKGKHL